MSRAAQALSGAAFLDPVVLARISNLELIARTVVEGFINGLHHAPYLGLSMDFAEHRAYMPGDDIRRIDWRLYARSDRYFVKQFEADTNANFIVLLDCSQSMDYGSGSVSKFDYARYLAACLTYFSQKQRDRVGLVTFSNDVLNHVPPSAKHLEEILYTLDRTKPGGQARLLKPLRHMAEFFKRRSFLVLISDFYEEPTAIMDALKFLHGRGNDVIVFHVLDPAELEFPFDAASAFEDLETGEQLPIVPEALRAQYQSMVKAHTAALGARLSDMRVDYTLLDTSAPLDYALFNYLSARERLRRVR